MNKLKKVNIAVMIIGLIGMLAGVYAIIDGGELEDHAFNIFLGFILIGTGYINQNQKLS